MKSFAHRDIAATGVCFGVAEKRFRAHSAVPRDRRCRKLQPDPDRQTLRSQRRIEFAFYIGLASSSLINTVALARSAGSASGPNLWKRLACCRVSDRTGTASSSCAAFTRSSCLHKKNGPPMWADSANFSRS